MGFVKLKTGMCGNRRGKSRTMFTEKLKRVSRKMRRRQDKQIMKFSEK